MRESERKEIGMKGKQLLFVTYHDENFDEGLSYAMDLARTMKDSISVLLIYKRKIMEKLDDMMTAITFAESDDYKTAREMISEDYERKNEDYEKKLAVITGKCKESNVEVDVSTSAADAVSAVRNMLRQNSRIDMVLLSPSITNDGHVTSKVLNRLVKTASRPIVTMARQAAG
jgi:hypothetical protein